MSEFPSALWIQSNLVHGDKLSVKSYEVWDAIQSYCQSNHLCAPTKNSFGRILRHIFPNVNISCTSHDHKSVKVYKGIGLKANLNIDDSIITLDDLKQYIVHDAMCLPQANKDVLLIAMTSPVVANGNIIIKIIQFNNDSWTLKIRGIVIDVNALSLSPEFTCTKSCFDNVLQCVRKIRVCTGQAMDEKFDLHDLVITESVSETGFDLTERKLTRSLHCDQVVSWSSKTNVCRRCQKDMYELKRQYNDLLQEEKEEEEEEHSNETLSLEVNDHEDFCLILDKVFPLATDDMKVLLRSQHKALNCSKNGRRWDPKVISLCLSLWVRSRQTYIDLKDSGMVILPSGRQLQRYKNCVPQRPGVHHDILRWMHMAAKDAKIPEEGWYGGLIHDETKIQEDLVLTMCEGKPRLVGWVDTGEEASNLYNLKNGPKQPPLAREVLQVMFLGHTGFRFPVCHYLTNGVNACELYILLWDVVAKLHDWGFHIEYILQDGGSENRTFTNMHFNADPLSSRYLAQSAVFPCEKIALSQDFSHVIKKIRNSVLKSGENDSHASQYTYDSNFTRKMKLGDKFILWDHFLQAVEWDRCVNYRRIGHKITDEHLHPNQSEKMRNHLAMDMLNSDMLHLLQQYSDTLNDPSSLDSTIELVQESAKLIDFFHDRRPITSLHDPRLNILQQQLDWLKEWKKSISMQEHLSKGEKVKCLPSRECYDDWTCLLVTFQAVCELHLHTFPTGHVIPARFNSDIIENQFCQHRGLHNGNTTNPNYATYCATVNAIILGQSLKSRGRKSNAGVAAAKPFSFYSSAPTPKKRKPLQTLSTNVTV